MIVINKGNHLSLYEHMTHKGKMDDNIIKLHYEGAEHSIDANTLISSLLHLTNVIELINEEYGGGAKSIKIMVDTPEPGSFLIGVRVLEWVKGLFGAKGISYGADILTIFNAIVSLFKEKKGKPVDDNNTSIVINNYGKQYVSHITNIYNNPATREAISKSFETLNGDDNVEGFEVIGKDYKTQIPRCDFSDLVYTDFESEQPTKEDIVSEEDATLIIKSLHFEKGKQWTFLYRGENFRLTVKDDALMEKISEGMQFGRGDAIKVRLRTVKKFEPLYGVHVVASRKIVKFYDVIKYQYNKQGKI